MTLNAEKKHKASSSNLVQSKQGGRFGFVDNRPEVISQSIIINTIQRSTINTIQREKIKNQYGTFESRYYMPYPLDKDRATVGASFSLKWGPNTEKVVNGKFGLIQTVDRECLGIKKIDSQEELENHKLNVHDFFKRISIEGKEQHHIDSLAEDYGTGKFRTNHPVYGSMNKQSDLDIKSTNMELPFNSIAEVNDGVEKTDARLLDQPSVMRYLNSNKEPWTGYPEKKMYEVFNRDRFEVRIIGLSGPYKNKYLGGIKWGWVCDADGHRIDPTSIQALDDNCDNTDFIKASKRWNAVKVDAPLRNKILGTLKWGILPLGLCLGGFVGLGLTLGGISGLIGYYRNKRISTVPIPLEKEG